MVARDNSHSHHLLALSEMLAHIFEFLRYNKYDLWSCSLVNKQWLTIVNPVLWRNPTFSSKRSIKAFQRAILENKEIAKLVIELNTDRYKRHEIHPLAELTAHLPCLEHIHFSAAHYTSILPYKREASSLTSLKGIQYLEISPKDIGWRSLMMVLINSPHLEKLGLLINGDLHLTLDTIPLDFPCLSALSSLDLQYFPQSASSEFFQRLFSFMPNLRRLKLYSFFISSDIVKVISQHCHHLEALHLISAFMPDDITAHKIFDYISTNQFRQNLREFWLNLVNYTQYIGALDIPCELMNRFCDTLSHVDELQLCGITFNHGTMRYFASNISKNLRSFKLSKVYCRDIQGVFSTQVWDTLFHRCGDQLEHLAIEYLELPPTIGEIIAHRCVNLRSLCFRYTTVSDDSILNITRALGGKLQHLELRNTSLSTAGLNSVFSHCQRLEYLDVGDRLTRPTIGENFFREFILRCGDLLSHISLIDCCITNSHVDCIAQVCWNLHVFKLANQPALSDDGINRLLKRCRRLESLQILQEPHVSNGLTIETITRNVPRWVEATLDPYAWARTVVD
ncbi:RNI-like protein [Basidiobolus meristosporus CBS 931.73]|uniref:RNI-like protein n=1 Tax=Basidiobolus meristosporus CBS 931.73 TaxID=1314790 RepID=A0A1Y1YFG2_9FUNG|nr:RNI-like protein [Basidiobolus meristosporus CBS 931.73]|eukprot:ORX96781.1 RNI-like protein [Basidiobolus meristosporus CBS 931.73]